MRTRPITVLAAALALLVASPLSAQAQESTPTPTVTPSPTADSADAKTDWPKDVQRVYDDYRRDGVIDVCDHTQETLQKTLDTIEPAYDQDYPDFREAVSAGIERHKSGKCTSDSSSSSDDSAGAGAGATPAPSATPGTDTGSAGSSGSGAESGTLPQDDGGTPDSGAIPPEDNVSPQSSATPAPTAPPAAPAATPPPAAPAATPQESIVHTGHRSLALPLALIAIAVLAALALAAFWFFSRRNPRVAHAWREAAFRTRGTWADFSDWLRLGR